MISKHVPIVAAVTLTFVLFAVLMNSVGAVILQSVLTFHVPKTQAALLEGCKDLSAAAASFVVVLYLTRLGYRRGTAIALLGVAAACFVVPVCGAFWTLALQFVVVGAAFAVAKTSVYVIVGLITEGRKQHASMTSALEGIFMIGVLSSYWLFSAWIDPVDPANPGWMHVYRLLGGASLAVAAAIAFAPLDERLADAEEQSARAQLLAMPRLMVRPFVLAFIVCAFLDVLVEQSIGSWLPTFNREVMNLPPALAVQLASLWAMGIAVGLPARQVSAAVATSLTCLAAVVAGSAQGQALDDLYIVTDGQSCAITPENRTGAKGGGSRVKLEDGSAREAAADLGDGWKVNPFINIKGGERVVLGEADGPGIINHIWLTTGGDGTYRSLILRIYWDSEATPSIEVPLGDFFAAAYGKDATSLINSAVVAVNPESGLNSFWQMPFRRKFRIELENRSTATDHVYYQIDYSLRTVPADAGYLHAHDLPPPSGPIGLLVD